MANFFIIVILVVAVLLILLVLAQDSKGGGLVGGAQSSGPVGSVRTADLIEKATWVLAISMMVFSIAVNIFIDTDSVGQEFSSPSIENAADPVNVPAPLEEAPEGTAVEGDSAQ